MKSMFARLFLLYVMSSCNQADSAIYFLPQNFTGTFAVVYNQKDGVKENRDGKHEFNIPENGILLTQEKFSEGWRNDIFLMKTDKGFDTLKMYLPNMDTMGKKFDEAYYKNYTDNANQVAVNFRQIRRGTFNKFDSTGKKIGSCDFEYELITIGKANELNDSVGKMFISNLEKYFQDTLCK